MVTFTKVQDTRPPPCQKKKAQVNQSLGLYLGGNGVRCEYRPIKSNHGHECAQPIDFIKLFQFLRSNNGALSLSRAHAFNFSMVEMMV